MHKKIPKPLFDEHSRILLTVRITVVYILTVLALLGAVLYYKIPLYGASFYAMPSVTLGLIWVMYYIVPLLLAVVFGLLFRPFGKSFRNIYFAILAAQILFSFIACLFRWEYLLRFETANYWKKSDRIRIEEFKEQHFDKNQDGFIDEIKLNLTLNLTKIRPGNYLLHGVIVPGATMSPFIIEGGGEIKIAQTGPENIFVKVFVIQPRMDLPKARMELQNFQVKFLLFRIATVDQYGQNLLMYTRWSPFFRVTGWDGSDREIYGDWHLLDTLVRPEIFTMWSPVIPKD